MDRLTPQQRRAILFGFLGILFVVFGLKFLFQWDFKVHSPLQLDGKPALLFFTLDDPCECMQELVRQADEQIEHWTETQRGEVAIYRFDFDAHRDLAGQYNVFRTPCLLLIDSNGKIVYRQDYPLTVGGPFKLEVFEAQIQNLASIE
jgi:hypothetical protein